MKIWRNHTIQEIQTSIEAEVAKAQNELNCAMGDVKKASSRLAFVNSAIQHLKERDTKDIKE